MGQISFEKASEVLNSVSNGNSSSVGFFTLKNDGDEAVVRFMHDDTSTFDIVAVHPVSVNGKIRKVNCIREATDPLNKCPFCESGVKLENRFFIHLIQYVKDEQGNIIPQAKIWERSLVYAKELASYINEYGPLSNCIFKIKRSGEAGSMDTKYQIMFASPQVYRPELYPSRPELFEGYKTIGGIVMDRSYEDMVTYLSTGSFPQKQQEAQKQNNNVSQAVPNQYQPVNNVPPVYQPPEQTYNPAPQQPVYPNAQFTPVQSTYTGTPMPWESNTGTPINRPVRTY